MPTRRFSNNTDLQNLKKQAKTLLCAYRAGDASAREDFTCHPRSVDVAHVQGTTKTGVVLSNIL